MNGLGTYFLLVTIVSLSMAASRASAGSAQNPQLRTPILVELFTSEGCSSCPPADSFLEKLDASQPLPGAELIVMSEHVDYWNHDGWRDPFSSSFYTDRQSAYARRFGLDGPYTPEMVVDGSSEFVGSNVRSAEQAFSNAAKSPKIPVTLSSLSVDATGIVHGHVETGALPDSFHAKEAEVFTAVVLNHAESQVLRGENAGHHLAHSNVANSLKKVGVVHRGDPFSQDIEMKLEPGADHHNLRVIAFVQEKNQGKVLGATVLSVEGK